ncbi:hypothetical protein [Iodobacter sp.]|uniref:hypothetical protein n=1 Tax=Iodobacter sp. TaxID=1915058 RepID=UPI0025E49512|nr:hypothetical protein [Iodobacter sp.]
MFRVLQPVKHGVREGDVVIERDFMIGEYTSFPEKDAKELLKIGVIERFDLPPFAVAEETLPQHPSSEDSAAASKQEEESASYKEAAI